MQDFIFGMKGEIMNVVVVGLGKIARRIIQGISEAQDATLYGVASRNKEKALNYQKEFEATTYFDSYEAVMQDEQVELVYLATINDVHYLQIKDMLMHKKHVLCEKPMVASEKEVAELFAIAKANNVFLMEAHKGLFTPLNQKLKKLVDAGKIGDLVALDATYSSCVYADPAYHSHWVFNAGFGGCTYDIGVYPISYINYFANSDLKDIHVERIKDKDHVEIFSKGLIRYSNEVIATFQSGWNASNENNAFIYGTKGFIKTKNFWKTNIAVFVDNSGNEETIRVPLVSDFKGEIEHAIHCITNNYLQSPIMGEKQSMAILKVVNH